MAEEQAKPKSAIDLGKIMTFAFIGLSVLANGAGLYLVWSSTLGYSAKVTTEKELNKEIDEFRKSLQGGPVMLNLAQFNTNLDGVPRRMIRVEMNLEMLDEEGFEEIIDNDAEARDMIMKILNSKKFDELETVQGKLQLKTEIVAGINEFLDRGVVKNVYFTDFVVQ